MAPKWYVIRTEPRAEFLAAGELERDGFEVFSPRIKQFQPRIGRPDTPLFPGYLFLRCDTEGERLPSFRRTHRITGWVGFGGDVPWLPDHLIAELKQRVKEMNGEDGLWQRYRPGEMVRVTGNNLDSLAEVVEEAKSPQARARVLMQFMGRLVQVQVPWQQLSRIPHETQEAIRAPRRTRGKGRWNSGFGPRASALGSA